jgi:hypothetical protein
MARHVVTVKELTDWMNVEVWHKAACSFGSDSSKSLEMSTGKTFRVKDHGNAVYIGKNLGAAIAAYNDAP